MTLQHIVLFSFPRDLSDEEATQMRDMVASWPTKIGLMTRCRFGTDLTGARNRGYAYLLYTEFPDVDAHECLPGSPCAHEVPGLADGTQLHAACIRLHPG